MVLVFAANNHDFAVSFDNSALVAHRLYRRSYFHDRSPLIQSLCLILTAPYDPALGQIVRAHFQLNPVPGNDFDIIHSEFTRNIRRDDMPVR